MIPLIGITCRSDESKRGTEVPRFSVNQSYIRCVEAAGGLPFPIPLVESEDVLRAIYDRLGGLLLTGGDDVDPAYYGEAPHPKLGEVDRPRDRVELALTRWALADGLPILAICRGIQVLNVAAGGTLYQDIAAQVCGAIEHTYYPDHPRDLIAHPITVEPGSRLAAILGDVTLGVNSLHHQAVKDVAPGFAVTARAPDGLVEAIEGVDPPFVLGVQWHPEEMTRDARMQRLFEVFVRKARANVEGQRPGFGTESRNLKTS
jgi:putative glutamine amidotransferase